MRKNKRAGRGLGRSLSRFFLLDLWADSRSRLVIVYVFIVTALGAAFYHYVEGWSWLDSFYFVVITTTTIGYGDLVPTTEWSRLMTIFFAINGVVLLLTFFDEIRRVRSARVAEVVAEVESELGEGDAGG